jgi:cytochrome c553
LRVAAAALLVTFAPGMNALAADAPPPGKAKAQMCVPCHGVLGIGTMPDTPNLAGQPRIYLVEQLKQYRGGKRHHEVMNVVAKPLSDADIADLAEWFASIAVEAKVRP